MPNNQPPVDAMQDETKAREVLHGIAGPQTYYRADDVVAAMIAFQSEARAVPPDGDRGFQARAESMMFPPNAERSELVAAIERAGWKAVAAIAEDRGDTNVAAQARARLSLPHQADREAIARIIDPEEWALDDLAKAKGFRSLFINESLAKADRILALSPTPSAGNDANECICPKCGLRHGGGGPIDAGF